MTHNAFTTRSILLLAVDSNEERRLRVLLFILSSASPSRTPAVDDCPCSSYARPHAGLLYSLLVEVIAVDLDDITVTDVKCLSEHRKLLICLFAQLFGSF